jgi:hypothetical protein
MEELQHLGERTGVASVLFDEQQRAPQPSDDQQARRIDQLVQRCQYVHRDCIGVSAAFLQDGTWRRLMTWAVRGLDEALSHAAPDLASPFPLSQLSHQSGISERICGWYLDAGMSMQEQAQVIKRAVAELADRGYREVTALVRAGYGEGEFTSLCVVQEPDGSPVYCRTASEVFTLLQTAQFTSALGTQPAPDPSGELWRVVGNFDQFCGGG